MHSNVWPNTIHVLVLFNNSQLVILKCRHLEKGVIFEIISYRLVRGWSFFLALCSLYTVVHGRLNVWYNIQQQQQPFNGRLSGTTQVGQYQKKHSPAHTHPGQRTSLSPFSICNGPRHPLYSAYVLDSPLEQPLFRFSLVFPFVLNP